MVAFDRLQSAMRSRIRTRCLRFWQSSVTWFAANAGRLPKCTPRSLALVIPSFWRSALISVSNWPMPPRMLIRSRPVASEVSEFWSSTTRSTPYFTQGFGDLTQVQCRARQRDRTRDDERIDVAAWSGVRTNRDPARTQRRSGARPRPRQLQQTFATEPLRAWPKFLSQAAKQPSQ